jgi:hypothetical protein
MICFLNALDVNRDEAARRHRVVRRAARSIQVSLICEKSDVVEV